LSAPPKLPTGVRAPPTTTILGSFTMALSLAAR
jgi:hypothetical protein